MKEGINYCHPDKTNKQNYSTSLYLPSCLLQRSHSNIAHRVFEFQMSVRECNMDMKRSLNPRFNKQTLLFNHPVFAFMPVEKESFKYSAQGL